MGRKSRDRNALQGPRVTVGSVQEKVGLSGIEPLGYTRSGAVPAGTAVFGRASVGPFVTAWPDPETLPVGAEGNV